jgi:hypothetical protein
MIATSAQPNLPTSNTLLNTLDYAFDLESTASTQLSLSTWQSLLTNNAFTPCIKPLITSKYSHPCQQERNQHSFVLHTLFSAPYQPQQRYTTTQEPLKPPHTSSKLSQPLFLSRMALVDPENEQKKIQSKGMTSKKL